jgi:hypothetical protein
MALDRLDNYSIIEVSQPVWGILSKPIDNPAPHSNVKLDGGGAMMLHPHLAGDVILQELGFPTLYGHCLRRGECDQRSDQPSGRNISSTVRRHGQPWFRSTAGHLCAAA